MKEKFGEEFLHDLINRLDSWLQDEDEFEPARMKQEYFPYTQLFSPITINKLQVKNRIMMGPMGNVYMAEESGRPSQKMINFLTERAKGGAGLISTGLVPVGQGIDPGLLEPGDLSLFPRLSSSRSVYSGWKTLTENIHAYGSRLFIQISPGAGRVGSPLPVMTKLKLPVSASWNPNFYLPAVPCRPLSDLEVWRLIGRMGQTAADAQELGMDGVYIHGHEGYLLDQFTNMAFNRRWLGFYKNYQHFALGIIKAIRQRVGQNYPIMYRIGLSAAFRAVYGSRMESEKGLKKFKRERLVIETLDLLEKLVQAGVDCIDVDLGVYDAWWLPHPPPSMPSGCYLPLSRLVKEYFTEKRVLTHTGSPVPVVAVGKLGYPDLCEKALREGDCDMVMLARPLLADSDWPKKAFAGEAAKIRPCIGDQEACLKAFIRGTHIQCAVNPRAGFEDVFAPTLQPALKPKRIGLVGAGPAGIQFALTALSRGHTIAWFEKRERIGGMLIPGSVPKLKYEIRNYLNYLTDSIEEQLNCGKLTLHTSSPVSAQQLKDQHFDCIVAATGGKPYVPDIPGIANPNVIQAVEALDHPEKIAGGARVIVIGGGSVGCEIAHWLAAEKNCRVAIVEPLPYLMKEVVTANRNHLLHLLEKLGVEICIGALPVEIQASAVMIDKNISETLPDPYNTWNPILPENIRNPVARAIRKNIVRTTLQADTFVLASGYKPDNRFYADCVLNTAAPELHLIGDAFQTGKIFEAVKSGYMLAKDI